MLSNVRIPTGSKGFLCVGALLVLITASAPQQTRAQAAQTPAAGGPDQYRTMLSTYCFTCHNTRVKPGGLALHVRYLQTPEENAQICEKGLRKVRGRLIALSGNPQPVQKDNRFIHGMDGDRARFERERA